MIRRRAPALAGLAMLGCLSASAAVPSADWFPQAPELPAPTGEVIRVSDVDQLFAAVGKVRPGGTILLADGHYRMPRYLELKTDRVTLRGESGKRERVILDGAESRHGELIGVGDCEGVTFACLTVANVKWNGIKINSDRGATRVRIYDCVIHNVWQRGIKGPAVPEKKRGEVAPRDCRVEFCLFYNDRPKRFSDDETDTAGSFNGNYVAGIDVMDAAGWTISDNVFLGLQGRTREGRAAVFLWQESRDCVIERNLILDCDIGIALGNHSRPREAPHASRCTVRDNLVLRCPETGILACHTRDCEITGNQVFDPDSRLRRLIWVLEKNDGLKLTGNLLVGPPIQMRTKSRIENRDNLTIASLEKADAANEARTARIRQALAWLTSRETASTASTASTPSAPLGPSVSSSGETLTPEVVEAMRRVHAGFEGKEGAIAQFGDSITYSMAFWSPMSWSDPSPYLDDDGLPARPPGRRWQDVIQGARDKGREHGNFSGWTSGQLLKAVDPVLERQRPVAGIIMIGTNDIARGEVPDDYAANLAKIIDRCLAAYCIPILNTLPPRRDRDEAVAAANRIIRELAASKSLPLVDYHAACLELRPGDSWDGTLISADGVHPSGGKTHDYSPENLKTSGYALRNWLNFRMVREIYFRVLEG